MPRRITRRRETAKDSTDNFLEALRRVGRMRDGRARWLLAFAKRERTYETRQLAIASDAKALTVRWDALAFAKGRGDFTVSKDDLPSWQQVTSVHKELWDVLGELQRERPADIEARQQRLLTIRDGIVKGRTLSDELPFRDGFMLQVADTLEALGAAQRRLRFCLKCQQPFVGVGRQRYDSRTCSQAHRTALYRERHREDFRAYRRRYYRRRLAQKLGKRVERISFQSPKRRETK
jgi:hypothetical protein